jgi:metallo-beta-lactamase family protein
LTWEFSRAKELLKTRNHKLPPIDIRSLNAVIITHAHLDHTGRLPLLARSGYKGPVFATEATIEIMRIILSDAVHIQALN